MTRFPRVRLALVCALLTLLGLTTSSAAVAHGVEVDAFGTDRNSLSGTIDEVCGPGPTHDAAAQRAGRIALIEWLGESFPEVQGFAGFSCREINNRRSACAGRTAPASSSCWSTHAAGRAIDVMVGGPSNQDGFPVGGELGDRIVNHLLERVDGVDNYRARIMGIQQLLWNGACWGSTTHGGDGITDVSQLGQDCVDDHDNHVHITLSEAGADGLTSFYRGAVADPVEKRVHRDEHLVLYEAKTGRMLLRGLDESGGFTDVRAEDDLGKGWTSLAAPDVGGNGDDEIFAYRQRDGRHTLREVRDDGSLGNDLAGATTLEAGYSLVATPDIDGDGDDELLLYRADDGEWALHELLSDGSPGPALQAADASLDVFYSSVSTPDLDGDGDDELVLYRRFDGRHVVMDFATPDPDADDADLDTDGDAESPFDLAVFDADQDGEVDVAVELRVVDEVSTPAEPDDVEAESVAGDDVVPMGGLGVALTAGFTTMATPDIDHDGVDELVLYRAGDGCLAVRHLAVADTTDDLESAPDEASDELQPCVLAPTDDAVEAKVEATEDAPAARWLVESWDELDPGWTAAVTVAAGPETSTTH